MKIDGDKIILESTGREIYANRGIIGISGGILYEGYDGDIPLDEFTDDERNELADFMIEQWEAFRMAEDDREAKEAKEAKEDNIFQQELANSDYVVFWYDTNHDTIIGADCEENGSWVQNMQGDKMNDSDELQAMQRIGIGCIGGLVIWGLFFLVLLSSC